MGERVTVMEPLMLRLTPIVISQSWLRILILIGEIITGLNRFNFQPVPVAASSCKGLVAGPIPCPEESYRVCVWVRVYVFVCVCVCVSLSSTTITSTPTVSR